MISLVCFVVYLAIENGQKAEIKGSGQWAVENGQRAKGKGQRAKTATRQSKF